MFTPPVGIMGICGNGALRALMYLDPPTVPHGNIFTKSLPARQAVMTSVGVSAPAIIGLPRFFTSWTVAESNPGATMNSAPESIHRWAVPASSTVPAPISTSSPRLLTNSLISSIAPGTVMVTSTIGIPPAHTASAACLACADDVALTIGTIPISTILLLISSRVIDLFPLNFKSFLTAQRQGFAEDATGLLYDLCSSLRVLRLKPFQRAIRAPAPFISCITSLRVAIVVSPGVVIASAPCAAPHSTAHCGPWPLRNP